MSSDDWKTEYEQLSADFRFFVQMGWQATVAVLAVDGLIVGAVLSVPPPIPRPLSLLPAGASLLTILMAFETLKWIHRTSGRVKRMRHYDRKHNFDRFKNIEKGFDAWHLGQALFALMISFSLGLFVLAALVYLSIPLS